MNSGGDDDCTKSVYVRSAGKRFITVAEALGSEKAPSPATPLVTKAHKALKKIEKPGFDSWVIDTGSGYHLAPRTGLSKEEKSSLHTDIEILLHTANGVIAGRHATQSTIAELGDCSVDVRVLKDTPRVLSVKLLVQAGFTFKWGEFGATLTHPDGTVTDLEVKGGVPLLALPAATARSGRSRSSRKRKNQGTGTLSVGCLVAQKQESN